MKSDSTDNNPFRNQTLRGRSDGAKKFKLAQAKKKSDAFWAGTSPKQFFWTCVIVLFFFGVKIENDQANLKQQKSNDAINEINRSNTQAVNDYNRRVNDYNRNLRK